MMKTVFLLLLLLTSLTDRPVNSRVLGHLDFLSLESQSEILPLARAGGSEGKIQKEIPGLFLSSQENDYFYHPNVSYLTKTKSPQFSFSYLSSQADLPRGPPVFLI